MDTLAPIIAQIAAVDGANMTTILLSAAGVAISALAGFVAWLFRDERALNARLREEMRADDKEMQVLMTEVQRFIIETRSSNELKDTLAAVRRIEAKLGTTP